MGDLLKDAIADAKTVKETALENAKVALQEAFTPRIQSMLSKKIQQEMDDEEEYSDEEEMDDEEELDIAVEPEVGEAEFEDEPAPDDEIEDELEDEVEDEIEDADIDIDLEDEDEEMEEGEEEMDYEDEEDEDELDLEAVLRELEDEDEMEDEVEDEEEFDIDEQSSSSDIGKTDNKVDVADASDEEDPGKGKLTEEDDEEIFDVEDDEEVEDDISIEEILKSLSEDDDPAEDVNALKEKIASLQGELDEHRNVIQQMRGTLQEVTLLNAKLLYTNKLFRTFELDNSKKMNVVETFDRAHNLREVKLVYSTLAESLKARAGKKLPIREIKKKGSSSKPVASTKPAGEQILTEGQVLKERFRKLANIK